MEIQMNKEIRNYTEGVFFGLTVRQCVCSAAAIVVSLTLYFTLRPRLPIEIVSWICIAAAAPFAALGFLKYHGMPAEKIFCIWLRSEVIEPRRLVFHANNIYGEALADTIKSTQREEKFRHEVSHGKTKKER